MLFRSAEDGYPVAPDAVERLLMLHRAYLEAAPPDGAMDAVPVAAADEEPPAD